MIFPFIQNAINRIRRAYSMYTAYCTVIDICMSSLMKGFEIAENKKRSSYCIDPRNNVLMSACNKDIQKKIKSASL